MSWLIYILYGFINGLGELMPVSNVAHDYFLRLMTEFDPNQPLLRLFVHLAALAAVLVLCRHRASHIYRELRIASQPPRSRRRQPDMLAVIDGRVVLTVALPVVAASVLANLAPVRLVGLPMVIVLLLLSGTALYVPHFLPEANRDSRHLTRLEALVFGCCAGLSVLPGLSRMGGLLSAGALRGCARGYMLEIAILLLLPVLAVLSALDLFALLAGGFAALTLVYFLQCLLAGAAAFGGACLAIAAVRFVSVNMGYTFFAYYNWGLGVFGFILYLMI